MYLFDVARKHVRREDGFVAPSACITEIREKFPNMHSKFDAYRFRYCVRKAYPSQESSRQGEAAQRGFFWASAAPIDARSILDRQTPALNHPSPPDEPTKLDL
jgi:hypothetical protein